MGKKEQKQHTAAISAPQQSAVKTLKPADGSNDWKGKPKQTKLNRIHLIAKEKQRTQLRQAG